MSDDMSFDDPFHPLNIEEDLIWENQKLQQELEAAITSPLQVAADHKMKLVPEDLYGAMKAEFSRLQKMEARLQAALDVYSEDIDNPIHAKVRFVLEHIKDPESE